MPTKTRIPVAQFVRFSTSDNSIVAGDLVSLSKSVDDNVVRCDASDITKIPAMGIAKSVSGDSVVVQLDYIYTLPGSYGVSISVGDILYSDPNNPGKVTATVPTTGFLQEVGSAKSNDKIILNLNNFLIKL